MRSASGRRRTAFEAKVFNVVAAAVLTDEIIAAVSEGRRGRGGDDAGQPAQLVPMIVGPGGDLLADAPTDKETLVMASSICRRWSSFGSTTTWPVISNRHELFQLKLRRERPMLLDAADVFEADAARSHDTASIGMAAE